MKLENSVRYRDHLGQRLHVCSVFAVLLALALMISGSAAAVYARPPLIKSYDIENNVYNLCCQANANIAAQNYTAARDLLTRAATFDPTSYSPNVHCQLADCYLHLKSYSQSIAEARQALKFNPASEQAIYQLAMCHYAEHDYPSTVSWLEKYIDMSSDPGTKANAQKFLRDVNSLCNLSAATKDMEARHDQEARRLLEKAAQNDPSAYSATIHSSLAYLLHRGGDCQGAVEQGKKALKYDPNDKSTVYTIGIAYGDMGRFDDAIQYVNRYASMEADPEQRENALKTIRLFQDDKRRAQDPANNKPDYLPGDGKDCPRWEPDRFPLKVYIGSGKGIAGYRPKFDSFITRAFDSWCIDAGKRISYKVIKDCDDADIKVVWTSAGLEATADHPNTMPAGLTHVSDEDNKINSATIRILTVDPFDSKRALEDGECASVCMHEVGHSLGLNHSPTMADVMYFRAAPVQTGMPTVRDKATIARLYGDYPVLTFVPATPTETAASSHVKYLPPPAFMPPKAPNTDKLVPPMFLPPPLSAQKKLQPPLFTPPSLSSIKANNHNGANHDDGAANAAPPNGNSMPAPMFVPPPLSSTKKKPPVKSDNNPLFFTPPPSN